MREQLPTFLAQCKTFGPDELQIANSGSVQARYAARIAAGEIEADGEQASVIEESCAAQRALAQHRLARKSSALGWIFGARAGSAHPLKGIYIYGEVGRGKTMLMDLFFAASEVLRKRRVHFHEFMTEVHERVHALRQQIKTGRGKVAIRSRLPQPRLRAKAGCFASTNSTSPTLRMR